MRTAQEIERNGMNITAIKEIRRSGSGKVNIGQSYIFYSGNQLNKNDLRTGFEFRENLTNFKPMNERLCYI